MPLVLDLPPALEKKLEREAQQHGVSTEDYALRLLEKGVPTTDQGSKLVGLLQSWIDEEDGQEQQDTGEFLVRALDENRTSNRPLFPPDLKGVSW